MPAGALIAPGAHWSGENVSAVPVAFATIWAASASTASLVGSGSTHWITSSCATVSTPLILAALAAKPGDVDFATATPAPSYFRTSVPPAAVTDASSEAGSWAPSGATSRYSSVGVRRLLRHGRTAGLIGRDRRIGLGGVGTGREAEACKQRHCKEAIISHHESILIGFIGGKEYAWPARSPNM